MKEKIKEILHKMPASPGIYKMLNGQKEIIYLGKAKNIKKRVKQYFQKDYTHSTRTRRLLENIDDIEFITVDTELEAVILESNLIKEHKPKYNVIMKDDKNFVYIKITKEDFPRIQIVRKIENDKALYFGPKTATHKVKEIFKVLKKLFPFRHCNLELKEKSATPLQISVSNKVLKYPCLDYYIKKCAGPCIAKINKEEYQKIIDHVSDFLRGHADKILQDLEKEMGECAKMRQFEKAAKFRDKIQKIHSLLEKQKVAGTSNKNQDYINYIITGGKAFFNLFQVREGKLLGQENFTLTAENLENGDEREVLGEFLNQYYEITPDIPNELIIPHPIEDSKLLDERYKFTTKIPQKGDKNKLLEMSLKNARIYADRQKISWREEGNDKELAMKELAKILHLGKPPKRMECYDISHLGGTDTVGSMTVFENGVPKNNQYRKFKLRTTINKIDDFQSLTEVLQRRLSHLPDQILFQDYKIRKASKKDWKFIKSIHDISMKDTQRNFLILEKSQEKKSLGCVAYYAHSDKIGEISHLWLAEEKRGKKIGHRLVRKALQLVKSKRLYLICKNTLRAYYEILGFQEIDKCPDFLTERYLKLQARCKTPRIIMAYEKYKKKTDESFQKIPDLIIIDGGKGQLSSASEVLKKFKLKIPHIALAKKMEEIFLPERTEAILLQKNNPALKLLQRIRDEAHRFAISFNQDLRGKRLRS